MGIQPPHQKPQDWFRFTPKKGERIRVRMMASFVGSAVDSLLWIYGPDGKQIGFADDRGGPDGFVDFTPSAAEEHLIRVGDHLGRGGSDHVYRIEINPIRPSMSLTLPRFGRDSQTRQVILVPRGGRFATQVVTNRNQWSGDIQLETPPLPEGVSLSGEIVAADMRSRVVVFEAVSDAPIAGQLSRFVAHAADDKIPARANFYQSVVLVTGPPNLTVFYRKNLTRLPIAVVDALPFSIDVQPLATPLLRTGLAKLKVTATRSDGFDAPITVRMLLKPPGVSAPSTVILKKGETEVEYPIDANSGARLGDIDLAFLGEATVDGATAFASSGLCRISIAEPFVDGAISMSAIALGSTGDMRLTLNHKRPLPGSATLRLMNLPAHVSAAPVTVLAGATDIPFRLKVGKKARRGKHRNLFCEVAIEDGEYVMLQRIANRGVLRVDPRKPAAAKGVAKAGKPKEGDTPQNRPAQDGSGKALPTTAPTDAPVKKTLSRLELLRAEAAARAGTKPTGTDERP